MAHDPKTGKPETMCGQRLLARTERNTISGKKSTRWHIEGDAAFDSDIGYRMFRTKAEGLRALKAFCREAYAPVSEGGRGWTAR